MVKKEFSVSETFDVKLGDVTVEGYAERTAFVPTIDPKYRFREGQLKALLLWWMADKQSGLYLKGPTGAGKSSMVRQFCARLNIPLRKITGNCDLEMSSLLGSYTLIGGDTVWLDGPLTSAWREGGICLFDEVDLVRPGVLTELNEVRDRDSLVLKDNGGEMIDLNPDFRLVATGNTAGLGDETGAYLGTGRMNVAFLDGFMVVDVDWPTPKEEKAIIMSLTRMAKNVATEVLEVMLPLARNTRESFANGELSAPLTSRGLRRWADFTWALLDPNAKHPEEALRKSMEKALAFAYTDRLPAPQQAAVMEVFRAQSES